LTVLQRLLGAALLARYVRGEAAYPFRPLVSIKADRDRRVRQMVAYAYRWVPYYRETMQHLGMTPADFQCADDLARLPLLRRLQIQRDPERFVSREGNIAEYVAVRNSGTSGRPCDFFMDGRTLFQYAAQDARARAALAPVVGKSRGYRQTKIESPLGSSTRVQEFYDLRSWLPPGVALHRQTLSLLDPPEVNARLIDSFRPDAIRGYGSYLAALFHHLHVTGRAMHLPKVLRYTSDALPDTARKLIEQDFRIPIFGTYEAAEAYNIAFECEQHAGMHLNIDLCPMRIVDAQGNPAPTGQCGSVVISNLINRGTVFLNYVLEDIASLASGPCPCGRSLPLLGQLEGRTSDWLKLPTGEWLHAQSLSPLFKGSEGIWQYQVIQDSPSHLTVLLVGSSDCSQQSIRMRIAAGIASILGEGMAHDIQFVDRVHHTAAGKALPLISRYARDPTPPLVPALTSPARDSRSIGAAP
jgi:phenylacetate-CoA ligase